ncbi:MAG: hypothetical protein ABIP48_00120 [Planctomycetota bacterium]
MARDPESLLVNGVVFQHGTQQRHDDRMLFGCELVRNGYIGQLKHVKIGSPAGATCPPQAVEPVPPGLDWEMWLGPAPWAPFTPLRIQSHPWYHISDDRGESHQVVRRSRFLGHVGKPPKNGTTSDGWRVSAGNSSAGQFLGRTVFRRSIGTAFGTIKLVGC